jgi:endonuclease/exonuclease/phosphatase family metal-dependent hydrolase
MNLSVLQWNIWFQEDIENIVKTLKAVNADIVCLQELTKYHHDQSHSDTIKYVADELKFHVYASEPMGRDDVARKQFNAIFSRMPLTAKTQTWINTPIGIGGASDEYRAYIEATVHVGSTELRIATTHMSYVDRFEMTDRKKQETEKLIEQIKGKSSLIFTGDLNASPETYTVQKIEEHLQNAGPEYGIKTWTTKPFKHNDFEENDLNWRLDYVFATPNVNVVTSKIIDTPYSDHLPILTEFRI